MFLLSDSSPPLCLFALKWEDFGNSWFTGCCVLGRINLSLSRSPDAETGSLSTRGFWAFFVGEGEKEGITQKHRCRHTWTLWVNPSLPVECVLNPLTAADSFWCCILLLYFESPAVCWCWVSDVSKDVNYSCPFASPIRSIHSILICLRWT